MCFLHFALLVISLLLESTDLVAGFGCIEQLSTCSCVTDMNGWTFDLSVDTNLPSFLSEYQYSPSYVYTLYKYNPCNPVNCGDYGDAAMCRRQDNDEVVDFRSIGSLSAMYFVSSTWADQIYLVYPYIYAGALIGNTTIMLECDPYDTYGTLSDDSYDEGPYVYRFKYSTALACAPTSRFTWSHAIVIITGLLMVIVAAVICRICYKRRICCCSSGSQSERSLTHTRIDSTSVNRQRTNFLDESTPILPVVSTVDIFSVNGRHSSSSLERGNYSATGHSEFAPPLFSINQPPLIRNGESTSTPLPHGIQAPPSYEQVLLLKAAEATSGTGTIPTLAATSAVAIGPASANRSSESLTQAEAGSGIAPVPPTAYTEASDPRASDQCWCKLKLCLQVLATNIIQFYFRIANVYYLHGLILNYFCVYLFLFGRFSSKSMYM